MTDENDNDDDKRPQPQPKNLRAIGIAWLAAGAAFLAATTLSRQLVFTAVGCGFIAQGAVFLARSRGQR